MADDLGGPDFLPTRMNLQEAVGSQQLDAARQSNFDKVIHDGFLAAASRPLASPAPGAARTHLTGATDSAVGEAKAAMMSTVTRPGVDALPETNIGDQLETRVMSIYEELTNYELAWKIAQRIQTDISTLMKGQ